MRPQKSTEELKELLKTQLQELYEFSERLNNELWVVTTESIDLKDLHRRIESTTIDLFQLYTEAGFARDLIEEAIERQNETDK